MSIEEKNNNSLQLYGALILSELLCLTMFSNLACNAVETARKNKERRESDLIDFCNTPCWKYKV